ncbi:MAG: serine hydrolase [Clostridia bacterium]|nr:serine hydrolase [Clostridia bacterium]
MANRIIKMVELVSNIALTGAKNPAVVPYYPQKTKISGIEEPTLKRSSPQKHGVSSKVLDDMLAALESEERANVHNLMIIKDGEVISECSAPGYDINTFHLSHSMSKSVIAMAIGMLVGEGKLRLDERVADIFSEIKPKSKKFAKLMVEDLLKMSSGVSFNEIGVVSEDDWLEAFFTSSMKFSPGERFAYNSMNSYVLSRIVERVSGMSVVDYMTPHLFEPLGIKNFLWERCPHGTAKGGFGLYMSAESWAKVGLMILGGGYYNGKQILTKEWVRESTDRKIATDPEKHQYDYGYHVWVGRDNDEILFNGMLGQNVLIIPKKNIVVSLNSGNNELFQGSPALNIIRSHLYRDGAVSPLDLHALRARERTFFESRRGVIPKPQKKSLATLLKLKSPEPFDKAWSPLLTSFTFRQNNYGILPLFVKMMQRNFSGGIDFISFEREGESLFMISREGGVDFKVEIGLYSYKTTILDFKGEHYIAKASGRAFVSAGRQIYRIEIVFPELPNTRRIDIELFSDSISFKMAETPDHAVASRFLEKLPENNPKTAFLLEALERKLGHGYIYNRLKCAFEPTLVGADTSRVGFEAIIAKEEHAAREELEPISFITSLIERFISSGDEDDEDEDGQGADGEKRSLISRLFAGR